MRKMDPFELVHGESIFKLGEEERMPLIEGIIYRKDYVLFAAEQKTGKTVCLQHMALCLSAGKPFLGVFDVPKPVKVMYIATEGKLEEIKDRFIKMRKKVDCDPNNLLLVNSKIKFNTENSEEQLANMLEEIEALDFKPDIIIIDPIYSAITGSLVKDDVVNAFNSVMFSLIDRFGCAIMAAHHLKKAQKDKDGKYFSRNDDDTYGSMFLPAAVDHILRLERYKGSKSKLELIMTCDTQRSGDIVEKVRMKMVEPDPLYMEFVGNGTEHKNKIMKILQCEAGGLTYQEIMFRIKMKKSTLFNILSMLKRENLIYKQRKGVHVLYFANNYIECGNT